MGTFVVVGTATLALTLLQAQYEGPTKTYGINPLATSTTGHHERAANEFRVEAMRQMSSSGVPVNSALISKSLINGDKSSSNAFNQTGGTKTRDEYLAQFKKKNNNVDQKKTSQVTSSSSQCSDTAATV